MKGIAKYFFASLPAIVTAGGWQLALWAYGYYGCEGNIKTLQPCLAGSMNLVPALGFGLFWCQILAWVCGPISLGLVLGYGVRDLALSLSKSNKQIRSKDQMDGLRG
jgi:hypothetical protein